MRGEGEREEGEMRQRERGGMKEGQRERGGGVKWGDR